jgi:hypothetical protein
MKNNNIPENLLEGLNTTEKRNSASIVKALVYLVVAVAATCSLIFIKDSKSSIYMLMGIVAAFGYIMAVCVLIFAHKDILCEGKRLNGHTLYFDTANANVEKAIASKDAKALKNYKNESENGLKLELAYSDDLSIARYRLYRYIPFEFQPDSEIIELNAEQVKVLTQL